MNRHRARMRRLLEQELLGELPPRHRARLHEHLRSDEYSRAEYDRACEAFRVLEGRDVARTELAMVEHWLFDGAPAWTETPERSVFGRIWTIAAVTAAAAAAAVLVLRTQIGAEADEYMGVRHGTSFETGLAIEALCNRAGSDGLQPARLAGCALSGTLAFAYRVAPSVATAGTLALFGIDDTGEVSYYAPTPIDDDPIAIDVGRWSPLPMSIRLEVNHSPGLLRLYAVVTPEPLTVEDVEEAARMLRSRDDTARAPWPARLSPTSRIGRLCAAPERCPSAALAFEIHEDRP